MAIDAENIMKKLGTREACIKKLLADGHANQKCVEKIQEYSQLVDELPCATDPGVLEAYNNKLAQFESELAELQRSQTPSNPTVAEPKVVLPKEEPVKHDGKVESFPPFLLRFNVVVGEVEGLTDSVKYRYLLGAVCPADLNGIRNLEYAKAIQHLKTKYTSATAMRTFFHEKLAKLRVENDEDTDGMRKLKEAALITFNVACECDDKSVLCDLFDMVHQRLPKHMGTQLFEHTDSERKADMLETFLEKKLKIMVATDLTNGGPYRLARQEKKSRGESKQTESRDEPKCFFCKAAGKEFHLAKDCKKLANHQCSACQKVGHSAKYCTNKKSTVYPVGVDAKFSLSKRREGINAVSWRKQIATIDARDRDDKKPRCKVTVGESVVEAVADSGSDVTRLPDSVVESDAPVRSFVMADGKTMMWTKGPVDTELTVAGMTVTHPVYTSRSEEAIIGSDLMDKYGAVIDYANDRSLKFTKPPEPKDMSEKVEIKTVKPEPKPTSQAVDSEKVEQLVEKEYGDLMEGLGKTDVIEHAIDTGDHPPIAVRGRRIPTHYVEAVAKHVKALLGEDIIEESNSEWLFPLVIVKKKDGEIRMANDLRKLNEICKKDSYPMPRVDEFFEKIGKSKVFSRVDLRKGYYQIMLREEDREKTAFAFKGKLYHFKRMPFGSSNAPQTFQRLMKRILGELDFVVIYLDDVLIFSNSEKEHMDHLRQVLDRIRAANLRLNKEKCEFGKEAIQFLGFHIKDGKKTPSDEKTKILANFPTPCTPRLLKGFLGLANFFRNLIPDFASLAQPLFEASNHKKLNWTDECEQAFKQLKEKLAANPYTYLPDLNVPFIVTSDASELATGAVLAQMINGERRIVDFMSRTFSDAEKRYSTIEREATAILWALEKWEHFLLGNQFTVESDHKPLHWLLTKVNLPGKLGRMAMKLQEYNIRGIDYVKGDDNILADALSRIEVGLIHAIRGTPTDRLKALMEKDPDRFKAIDGRVYLVEKESKRLCIDTAEEKKQILEEIHDRNGHLAFYKSSQAIRDRFYWPNWKNDLKQHLKKCFACQSKKDDFEPHKEELFPLESEEVFERVHIDICGPLTESDGNKYRRIL